MLATTSKRIHGIRTKREIRNEELQYETLNKNTGAPEPKITQNNSKIKKNKPRGRSKSLQQDIVPGPGTWTFSEDYNLRLAIQRSCPSQKRPVDWNVVSVMVVTKSPVECRTRFQELEVGNKGAWTDEEDRLLSYLVEHVGVDRWSTISSLMPSRSNKQCRERWMNHLDPTIKRDSWTEAEDCIIIKNRLQDRGWAEISKLLCGRSDNSIKNRFNSSTIQTKLKAVSEQLEGRRNSGDEILQGMDEESFFDFKLNSVVQYIHNKPNIAFLDMEKIKANLVRRGRPPKAGRLEEPYVYTPEVASQSNRDLQSMEINQEHTQYDTEEQEICSRPSAGRKRSSSESGFLDQTTIIETPSLSLNCSSETDGFPSSVQLSSLRRDLLQLHVKSPEASFTSDYAESTPSSYNSKKARHSSDQMFSPNTTRSTLYSTDISPDNSFLSPTSEYYSVINSDVKTETPDDWDSCTISTTVHFANSRFSGQLSPIFQDTYETDFFAAPTTSCSEQVFGDLPSSTKFTNSRDCSPNLNLFMSHNQLSLDHKSGTNSVKHATPVHPAEYKHQKTFTADSLPFCWEENATPQASKRERARLKAKEESKISAKPRSKTVFNDLVACDENFQSPCPIRPQSLVDRVGTISRLFGRKTVCYDDFSSLTPPSSSGSATTLKMEGEDVPSPVQTLEVSLEESFNNCVSEEFDLDMISSLNQSSWPERVLPVHNNCSVKKAVKLEEVDTELSCFEKDSSVYLFKSKTSAQENDTMPLFCNEGGFDCEDMKENFDCNSPIAESMLWKLQKAKPLFSV